MLATCQVGGEMVRVYLAWRLVHSVLVLVALLTIVFFLTRFSGDPAVLFLGSDATTEEIQAMREALGLTKPLHVQYANFIVDVIVRGDFGDSIRHREPALAVVLTRVPATVELALAGLLIAILIAIPAGVVAAVKRSTAAEPAVMVGTLIGQSIPNFWLALMLMLLFGVHLQWLPISGRGDITHLVMPALVVSAMPAARFTRLLRVKMLEVLSADYIRVARSKGLRERIVIFKHAFKNAAIPFITDIGVSFGQLLGGTVIVEEIFAWPGVGRLSILAVYGRDFTVVQASVLLVGVGFLLINLLVDILYAYLDPRIKYA